MRTRSTRRCWSSSPRPSPPDALGVIGARRTEIADNRRHEEGEPDAAVAPRARSGAGAPRRDDRSDREARERPGGPWRAGNRQVGAARGGRGPGARARRRGRDDDGDAVRGAVRLRRAPPAAASVPRWPGPPPGSAAQGARHRLRRRRGRCARCLPGRSGDPRRAHRARGADTAAARRRRCALARPVVGRGAGVLRAAARNGAGGPALRGPRRRAERSRRGRAPRPRPRRAGRRRVAHAPRAERGRPARRAEGADPRGGGRQSAGPDRAPGRRGRSRPAQSIGAAAADGSARGGVRDEAHRPRRRRAGAAPARGVG